MDTRTRHALKKDKFAQAAKSSASWISVHRTTFVRWAIGAGVVLVLAIGGLIYWNMRSSAANAALGAAVDVYTSPLAIPGAPPRTRRVYHCRGARERSQSRVCGHRPRLQLAARRLQGPLLCRITYEELGQNGNAESQLKAAAGSWNRNIANLAKLALAGLYQQTEPSTRRSICIKSLLAKPSVTVSAGVAQLAPRRSLCFGGKARPGSRALGQGAGYGQGWRGRADRRTKAHRGSSRLAASRTKSAALSDRHRCPLGLAVA